MNRYSALPCLLAVFALAATPSAMAANFVVGNGCTYTTIQAAISAAETNPGADTIRIVRNQGYLQQALVVSTSQALDIDGGFATCAQANADGLYTEINGAGGATEPVFRITANTGSLVRLRHLTIRGGDEDGQGYGGGIYFRGNGILEINDSNILQNTAGYGGGIYAQGTGINAELVIGQSVQIVGNTARYSGGGVYNEGLEMTMVAPDSYIANNHAPGVLNPTTGQYSGGYAGGLMIISGDLAAYAYVGSGGVGSSGPIYLNDARYGGGVAVISHETDAELRLFTTDPAKPVRIKSNSASVAGGGLYVNSYDIGAYPAARAWYAFIEDNLAPRGAATYFDAGGKSIMLLWFNDGAAPPGAVPCPVGSPCGGILFNVAENDSGVASGGVVESGSYTSTRFRRIAITRNRGKNFSRGGDFLSSHALIAENIVSEELVRDDGKGGLLKLLDTTIVGNSIGGSTVLRISNLCDDCSQLYRSIIWQPGKTILQLSGPPLDYLSSITNEIGSLAGYAPQVIVADPRFVDPARGDFSLRAASPAVDFGGTIADDTRDLYANARDVDLAPNANFRGPRDVGAIERPAIQPLVLNSNLDADVNQWFDITPGASSWTNTQNIVGATGSGSIQVSLSNIANPLVVARAQCVHLPGPGRYKLNGYGRGGGTTPANRDSTRLLWELRYSGNEGCTAGVPNVSGNHALSSSSSFSRPANPAIIDVAPDQWTNTSSVTIYLAVNDNGVIGQPNNSAVGWFDGITLEFENGDVIFRNGYDP